MGCSVDFVLSRTLCFLQLRGSGSCNLDDVYYDVVAFEYR